VTSNVDPCTLITPDQATQLVGQPVTGTRADAAAIGAVCHYVPSGANPRGFVDVAILTTTQAVPDPVKNAIDNIGIPEVQGVGDQAAARDGTVIVKTGPAFFSIIATDQNFGLVKADALTSLASQIVTKLGGTNASPSPSGSAAASPSSS